MITRTHQTTCPEQYLEAAGLDPRRVLYFDIETTGFKADRSSLYMIGWAAADQAESSACAPSWSVTQSLAEDRTEERPLLKAFSRLVSRYDAVIAFNGERFDLPYLRDRCAQHGIPDPFSGIRILDLYRELRPYRKVLGLEKLSQKAVERFLGIRRTDPYDGGQLIDVYRLFRDHAAPDPDWSLDALFLHNYEDVLGMLQLTPLTAYGLAFRSDTPVRAKVLRQAVSPEKDAQPEAPGILMLSREIPLLLPVPFSLDRGTFCLEGAGAELTVRIPLFRQTLRHFFPDYRNYYYLPEEDRAVHTSVGRFVDPAFRKPAKAENCYVKKEGVFLPGAPEGASALFRGSYREKQQWFEMTQDFPDNAEKLGMYFDHLISSVMN